MFSEVTLGGSQIYYVYARGTNTERQGNSMHSLNPGWDWTRLLQVTGDSYKMTISLKEAVKVHAVSWLGNCLQWHSILVPFVSFSFSVSSLIRTVQLCQQRGAETCSLVRKEVRLSCTHSLWTECTPVYVRILSTASKRMPSSNQL